MRKAKVLTLTMSLSLGCLAMAACAGKPEEYTVMGAKDWNIKASESTFDYSEGVVAILADGTEKAVKVDDSDVEYGKAGSYSIIYYYGKNSSDGVEKTVKIYDFPTFNIGETHKVTYQDARVTGALTGVTAKDSFDEPLTVTVVDDGGMSELLQYKTYTVEYSATDLVGNVAELTCAVTIGDEGRPDVEDVEHTLTGTTDASDCTFPVTLNGGAFVALEVFDGENWTELSEKDYKYDENVTLYGSWLVRQLLDEAVKMKLVTSTGEREFTLTLEEAIDFKVITEGYDNWTFRMGEEMVLPVPEVESYREMIPSYTVWKGEESIAAMDGKISAPVDAADYNLVIRVTMSDGIRTLDEIVLDARVTSNDGIVHSMATKQFESLYTAKDNLESFSFVNEEIAERKGVYKAVLSENNAVLAIGGLNVDRKKYDAVAFDIYSAQDKVLALHSVFGGFALCDAHSKYDKMPDWTTVSLDLRNYDKHNVENPDVGLNINTWGMEIKISNWDGNTPIYFSNLRLLPKGADEVLDFEGTSDAFGGQLPAIENRFTFNTNPAYVISGKQSLKLTSSASVGVGANEAIKFAVTARPLDNWKEHTALYVDMFIVGESTQFMKFHEADVGAWWRNAATGAEECYAGSWQTMRLDLTAVSKNTPHIWMWCAGRDSDTNISGETSVYIDNIRFEMSSDDALAENELLNFSSERYLEKISRVNLIYTEFLQSFADADGKTETGVIKLTQGNPTGWDSFRINLFEAVDYAKIKSISIKVCAYAAGEGNAQFNIAFNGSGNWDGCMMTGAEKGRWKTYTFDMEKIKSLGGNAEALSSVDIMFGGNSPLYIDCIEIVYANEAK